MIKTWLNSFKMPKKTKKKLGLVAYKQIFESSCNQLLETPQEQLVVPVGC